MNDVTFTMDQIRAAAFTVLMNLPHLEDEVFVPFTHGILALAAKLSDLAGENVKDSCLDKSEGAGPK